MMPEHLALLFFGMGILTQIVALVLSYIVDESDDADTGWRIFRIADFISFAFFVLFALSSIAAFI